jgi:hypothetical protein
MPASLSSLIAELAGMKAAYGSFTDLESGEKPVPRIECRVDGQFFAKPLSREDFDLLTAEILAQCGGTKRASKVAPDLLPPELESATVRWMDDLGAVAVSLVYRLSPALGASRN